MEEIIMAKEEYKKPEAIILPEEQEVTFNISKDGKVEVFASIPKYMKKQDKLCEENPEIYKKDESKSDKYCGFYTFPEKVLTIRTLKETKEISEEERTRRVERGKQLALARKQKLQESKSDE